MCVCCPTRACAFVKNCMSSIQLPPKREVVIYAPMTEFQVRPPTRCLSHVGSVEVLCVCSQLGLDDLVRQRKLREALASMGIDAKAASGELLSEKNILMNLRKVSACAPEARL